MPNNNSLNRLTQLLKDFFSYQLVAQKTYGATRYSLPVWLVLLLVVLFHQIVLMALLLALLTGHRLSLELK